MPSDRTAAFFKRLGRYRDLTLQTLRDGLPEHEPQRHLYGLIREHLARSGKGLRPALCLATCGAFGGRIEDALHSAAAIEMLHNAFLVHDDIEDESEYRRDERTMHTRHGVPLAVNAGDAMQALSMRFLRKNLSSLGPELAWRIMEEFDHLLVVSLEGQAMELGWIRDNHCAVSEEDYLRMILRKTSWYSFIHPCRIGALIARPHGLDLEKFTAFGHYLGAAFQIHDDILNLTGNRQKYGKEIGGDLYEGKRTLMLAHLFEQSSPSEKESLRNFLAQPRQRRLPRDVDWIHELLGKYGSIEFARSAARELLAAAEGAFQRAYQDANDGDDKLFIGDSLRYMIERDS